MRSEADSGLAPREDQHRRPRRGLIRAAVAVLVIGASALSWYALRATPKASPGIAATTVAPAVPVTIGVSEVKSVPVYLTGLGTVQAFNTVIVKSQVDGQLTKVLFTEGQDVKAGDVLAQIDSRSFQAQLDQAIAKKQLDEASLAMRRISIGPGAGQVQLGSPVQQLDTQRALVAQLEAPGETRSGRDR